MTANELNEQRLGIIAKQRELNDKTIEGKRDFTAEEDAQYKAMDKDANDLKAKIDRMLALEKAEKDFTDPTRAGVRPGIDPVDKPKGGPRATAEYAENFRVWMQRGDGATPAKVMATLQRSSTGTGGGNYLVPIEYETELVRKLLNVNIMRQLATVTTTSKDSVIPIESALPTFAWIDELGVFGKTQGAFGATSFFAYKYGGIVQISEELMDDADQDMAGLTSDQGAKAAGLLEEAAFIVGDGNKKPTGIVTSASGLSVTAAPAAITFDDIQNAIYATPRYYRTKGVFVFSDTAVLSLRKAKSTTGEYLWQPAVTAGAPDLVYGKPFYTTDFLPAVAAGSISGFFGDVSQYQILDRRGWAMQRLNELYAETGQVGFRMWGRVDGHLLRPDAITLIQQHA